MKNKQQSIFGGILILLALGLGIWQWGVRQNNVDLVESYEQEISLMTASISSYTDTYQDVKVRVNESRETALQEVALVFPNEESITDLTRMLDDFAVRNNFSTNPFFISNLQYQSAQEVEDGDYRYVPVSMNITSSSKNLNKFLEFIASSGSLEGETRLMSIEDLTIQYPSEYGGTYELKVLLNAYFSQEL
jgi:Tfp pilus assembly protein PilO